MCVSDLAPIFVHGQTENEFRKSCGKKCCRKCNELAGSPDGGRTSDSSPTKTKPPNAVEPNQAGGLRIAGVGGWGTALAARVLSGFDIGGVGFAMLAQKVANHLDSADHMASIEAQNSGRAADRMVQDDVAARTP